MITICHINIVMEDIFTLLYHLWAALKEERKRKRSSRTMLWYILLLSHIFSTAFCTQFGERRMMASGYYTFGKKMEREEGKNITWKNMVALSSQIKKYIAFSKTREKWLEHVSSQFCFDNKKRCLEGTTIISGDYMVTFEDYVLWAGRSAWLNRNNTWFIGCRCNGVGVDFGDDDTGDVDNVWFVILLRLGWRAGSGRREKGQVGCRCGSHASHGGRRG